MSIECILFKILSGSIILCDEQLKTTKCARNSSLIRIMTRKDVVSKKCILFITGCVLFKFNEEFDHQISCTGLLFEIVKEFNSYSNCLTQLNWTINIGCAHNTNSVDTRLRILTENWKNLFLDWATCASTRIVLTATHHQLFSIWFTKYFI